MPKMHLREPGSAYSACGPFTKKQRKNKNTLKKPGRFTIYLSKPTR